ncbi:hypothetical protein RJ639_019563 [Escallonia herrerae]|uniref:Uncharacterized protein n=1 Tax=Escallonia herrerae TaxID=1293975 RepID=A0AA88V8N1_9ASTE|nr:hypothetical protein RJ639_019563 [Escallonia herrerae]
MDKENRDAAKLEEASVRITRARAKALGTAGGLPPQKPPLKQEQRQVQPNSKRAAPDNNKLRVSACLQDKKRAVLKDSTNTFCDNSKITCLHATKVLPSQARKANVKKNVKVVPTICIDPLVEEDTREKVAEDIAKTRTQESILAANLKRHLMIQPNEFTSVQEQDVADADLMLLEQTSNKRARIQSPSQKGNLLWGNNAEVELSENLEASDGMAIAIIDSDHKDPQMCSVYAANIYTNLCVTEVCINDLPSYTNTVIFIDKPMVLHMLYDTLYYLQLVNAIFFFTTRSITISDILYVFQLDRRPSVNYMQMLQRDVTQGMRGILIDWLVELSLDINNGLFQVSEEYRLVPDTLYLTVNLIDRYLSEKYIGKQRLQLLGITCMLIASKYEEICAPRVEEFCFITDNTYKREEVLKMESHILNVLGFQLSAATTKKFLRRFIQAAQSMYKVPCIQLEFLSNYLAELSLTEYSFLKFLPSLIAASAVFLARWTLDQSDNPWNLTLQHYTSYHASDLKATVVELHELQLNTKGSSLNAIREKYKQQKVRSFC